eukprot:10454-Heterococcus_DN1.PRE.3
MKPWEGIIFAHGAMAGNTLPTKWMDNAGSIRRRLFVINFAVRVKKTQGNMLQQLRSVELPAIIRKIVWCYRHAVVLVGDRDLWSSGLLSPHIYEQNDDLNRSTNPLRQFLDSEDMKFEPTNGRAFNWCPLTEFKERFNEECTLNHSNKIPWTNDFYSTVFSDKDLEVRIAKFKWGEDAFKESKIVVGCCHNGDLEKMVIVDGEDNPVLMDGVLVSFDAYAVPREIYDADDDSD